MSSNQYTPAKITADKIRFFIPLYQRLFTWSTEEVECLLKDLEHHFSGTGKDTPYYLGIITTVTDKTTGKKILVDGQQRLTVLMLFAAVFRKSEDWQAFFDGGERIELFARKEDSVYLRQLAKGTTTGKYVNERMKLAYEAIVKFIGRLTEKTRQDFIDRIFSDTTLFDSALPDSYLRNPESLNRYFEVMNSAGVSLEPHEVLKVKLLKEQPDQQLLLKIWNLCSDFSRPLIRKQEDVSLKDYREQYRHLFEALYNKEPIADIVDRLMKELPSNTNAESETSLSTIAEIPTERHRFDNRFEFKEERSVLTFPEFLLLTLDIFKKQNGEWAFYKVDKLNERFTELLRPEEVPAFYAEMLKLRIVLDYFVIRRTVNGTDSDYSLLFTDKDDNERLMQYEAMLHVSTPAYEWIKPLYEYVLSTNRPDAASLLIQLKTWDNEKHGNKVPDKPALRYTAVDRYWFWRLDYYLWETYTAENDRQQSLENDIRNALESYRFKANRSIEHLHPQNQCKNETWSEADINSFGNLAMISQSFNSQQSNDEVHVKFSRLETQIRSRTLQSLKLLFMYLAAKRHPDEWTSDCCDTHKKEMIAILNESFAPADRDIPADQATARD